MKRILPTLMLFSAVSMTIAVSASAQPHPTGSGEVASQGAAASVPTGAPRAEPSGATLPADYVIGPDDVLSVVFWREPDLSADVVVRPDGKISLPLLHDVYAAGLTPDELRERVTEQARQFVQDPNATVVVREINSRRVFITGEVSRPGTFRLTTPTTVVQLIAMAGGLTEFADGQNIVIIRTEPDAMTKARPFRYKFQYKHFRQGKNLRQNIELKPGDTIVVP